jgi:hypothetical protein
VKRLSRIPIGVQLVALLVAGLLVAQAINILVLFALPPPEPVLYRLSEVATALKGGSLAARDGRPMVRTTATVPPPPKSSLDDMAMVTQVVLAETLGRPVADVRLYPANRAPFFGMMNRRSFGLPLGEGPPRREPPSFGRGRGFGPGGPPPDDRMMTGARPRPGDLAVFGDFTAALRNPSGGWTVIISTPEPFPNDWQRRALLWLLACFLLVAPAGYLFARRITAPLTGSRRAPYREAAIPWARKCRCVAPLNWAPPPRPSTRCSRACAASSATAPPWSGPSATTCAPPWPASASSWKPPRRS